MKILKQKRLLIILGIVILFFGLLIKLNYSVDTYLIFSSPKMGYIKEYILNARIFTFVFFLLSSILRLPPYIIYLLSYLLAIVFLTLSIYGLSKILDNYVPNKILATIISIAILINPFTIELWLFLEMGIMALSIFAIIKAYKFFDKYLREKEKNKKLLIYSLIWNMVSIFAYQGTFALFMALASFSIVMNCKEKKDFIKNNVIALALYGIPTVINYLCIIIFSTKRVGGSYDIGRTINNVLTSTLQLINGFGLLFRGFTVIFLLITIILTIFYILKRKDKKKNILFMLYIIFVVYIFTILPIIPQTGDRIAIYPRTCYAFFSIIGLLFLLINNKENTKILISLLIVLLAAELLSYTRIEMNRFKVNELDKEIVMQIEEKVQEYENRTNNDVTKLAVYNLSDSKKFYDRLEDNINVSAIKEEPSGIAIYTYYTKRHLEYVEADNEVYENSFRNTNSDSFSLDQVVIIDDTIHWYLY